MMNSLKVAAWIGIFLIVLPLSNYLSSRDTDIPAGLPWLQDARLMTTGFPFPTFAFYPCSACDADVTREALLGLGGNIIFWLIVSGLIIVVLPKSFFQRKYIRGCLLVGIILSSIYVFDIFFWINN